MIEKLIKRNHKKFLGIAKRHCYEFNHEDLIAELYLYLIENKSKMDEIKSELELEKFCNRWITNQCRWSKTPIKKKYQKVDVPIQNDVHYDINMDINNTELSDEEYRDLSQLYDDEQINKLIMAYKCYKDVLSPAQQVFFEMYFLNGYSLQNIMDNLKIKNGERIYNNRTIVFLKIKEIKNIILLQYELGKNIT